MSLTTTFSLRVWLGGALALGVVAFAIADPAPEVSLSLRGVAARTIQVGEPLFVAVRLEVPEGSSSTVDLAPATGTWMDAVAVGLSTSVGVVPKLRAKPAFPPESAAVKLDGERPASGVWLVASSDTGQLAPGDYVVQARLVIREGNGWKGEAISEAVPLHVVAVDSAPERAVQRGLAQAQEAALAGSLQEAARIIDVLLSRDPDNIRVLTARAALCVRGGNPRGAMVCLNRAIGRVEREGIKYPPAGLFEMEEQVAEALMTPGSGEPNPAEWTRLPASVLAPVPDERTSNKESARPAVVSFNVPSSQPAAEGPATPSGASGHSAPAGPGGATGGVFVPAAELTDARIAADAAGQWAASATAGTQYGRTQYSAAQATGAPNIAVAGNSPDAWCPATRTNGIDWLDVGFAKPVHATEVRIRQNDAAGAITKIEAVEPDGTAHLWWEGTDPYVQPAVREIAWFAVRVPQTGYLVARVKITLNLASGPGYKEIDAVQLVGRAE